MRVKPKNTNRFRYEFQLLEHRDRERVLEALKTLAETAVPSNAICLEKNYYRLRTGGNFGDTILNYGIQVRTCFFFGGLWSRVKRSKSNPNIVLKSDVFRPKREYSSSR
jgi:hypothetical protein